MDMVVLLAGMDQENMDSPTSLRQASRLRLETPAQLHSAMAIRLVSYGGINLFKSILIT